MKTDPFHTILMIHPSGAWGGGTIAFFKDADTIRSLNNFKPILLFGQNGSALQYAEQENFVALVAPVSTTPFGGILVGQRSFSISHLLRFISNYLPTQRALNRIISEYKIDMVYISTSVLLGTANMASRRRLPVIMHVREFVNGDSIGGRFARLMIRNTANIIITNSLNTTKPFATHKQVYPIYDGITLTSPPSAAEKSSVRHSWGFTDTMPIIGMVSPIIAYKGHVTFIDAIPTIIKQHPDARFVIVGSTPMPTEYWQTWKGRIRRLIMNQKDFMQTLKERVVALNLSDYVIFDGWRNDIPLVLSSLDIVVFPSLLPEGFGRPIVEAGAAYRPIIASDIGPASELVRNGETGMLFPPGDAGALADCLLTLLQNRELAEAMGQAGRANVERTFSDEEHSIALRKVFAQLLSIA